MITININEKAIRVGKRTYLNREEFAKILGVKPETLANKICKDPVLKSAIVQTHAGEMVWIERAFQTA
ncbi:MAG TPA: hypothetical protein DCQ50_07590 [Chryseobacterium sp.]|nr:hypothetical protein [Chryseobacterium sp.]